MSQPPRRAVVAAAVTALAAGCGVTAATGAHSASAATCPAISARLGLHWPYYQAPGVVYPENSLGAIDAAKKVHARKVEVDVQFSKPASNNPYGVPMVIHDPWVDRVTAHKGYVNRYYAYGPGGLTTMRLRMEGVYSNWWMSWQKMPALDSALWEAWHDGLGVSVEVKPDTLSAGQASVLDKVLHNWSGADVRSYDPPVLAAVRAHGWSGRLTLTVAAERTADGKGYWQESVDYADYGLTSQQVSDLHAEGVQADAYTPETAAQFAGLPAGLDQVTTDNAAGLAAAEANGSACGG